MSILIANSSEEGNCDNKSSESCDKSKIPANFETAITAAGFGRFNILLLIVAFPAAIATVFETAVVSYILPSAECDLNLDLVDKGILNAVTYGGMIVSAIPWGYLADTKGRKHLLIMSFFVDVLCVICSALSQNFLQLIILKFIGGLVMCGPYAILMSYLTEFHGSKHRARIMMVIGIMFSTAALTLPILALLILPKEWDFRILSMGFHSWQVFLAVCAMPSLVSGICLCFFPESPRFLMSQGRNAEALRAFQTIYAINKGKPKDTYPITELINEVPVKIKECYRNINIATIEGSMKSVKAEKHIEPAMELPTGFKALFHKPYLNLSIKVYILSFCILMGQNTMRLWLPQLFASLREYELLSNEATSMCSILEYSVNKTELVKNTIEACVVIITPSTYTKNIVVGGVCFVGYLVAGSLINALGNKRIQVIALIIAGTSGLALYWSSSSLSTLIIASIYSCMGSISATSAVGTSVNLFPTSLRTMIVSLSLMFGRIGSIAGNVLFPVFMSFGCIPPFLMIGAIMYRIPQKKIDLKLLQRVAGMEMFIPMNFNEVINGNTLELQKYFLTILKCDAVGCITSAILPSTKKVELK